MPTPETWFDRAERYLANADLLHGADDREAMVQLSQAAEYALKGVQTARTGSHRRGHDLVGLGHEVSIPEAYHETLAYVAQAYARWYPEDERFEPRQFATRRGDVEGVLQWARNEATDENGGDDT